MSKLNVKTKYFSARRLAMLSVLSAMGLITFMIESLFPPLFLPGAKMGLSNVFSMLAVFLLGPLDGIVLVVVRTTLGSVFMGNMSTLMYSMSAGLVSVAVSSVLVEFVYPKVSIVSISIVSAVMHNLTQNVVFCLISNTPQMFSYMPWLALLGVVAGIIVGFAVWFVLRSVPVKTFAAVLGVSSEDFAQAVGAQQAVADDGDTVPTLPEQDCDGKKNEENYGINIEQDSCKNAESKDGEPAEHGDLDADCDGANTEQNNVVKSEKDDKDTD